MVDDDLAAKQFDLLVFRTELALLRADPGLPGPSRRIIEIASLLEDLSNVPMVAAEMALIQEVQTDDFWQDVTLPMLETVRRKLRALVKLIEHAKRPLVYSDFEDRTGAAAEIAVPGFRSAPTWTPSAARRGCFLKPHENHIAVLKLKRNEPLTPTDLAELERIFVEAGVDETSLAAFGRWRPRPFRPVAGRPGSRGGQAAFAEFLNGRPLTADQFEFLNRDRASDRSRRDGPEAALREPVHGLRQQGRGGHVRAR